MKRVIDMVLSVIAIVLLGPLMLAIAVFIRACDPGPALFRQERAGKGGKPFFLLKFRTMKTDADPFGKSPESGDDPRLIKGGKFLREYSLDELPQLFNVLKGQMSLVGPRPLYLSQVAQMNETHRKRLLVRPGITGMSQVMHRNDLMSQESLDLEAEYAQQGGLWTDGKILCKTIGSVLSRQDVYER
ncbi:MAG: sugar transferase [Sedimentisphaerales bacterium]|nr:sugar transferase [Sedimentisphaerales bacterium]